LFYIILNTTDELGERKPKWIATALPVKGNKKRAEEMLMNARMDYTPPGRIRSEAGMLFADFIEKVWLPSVKHSIERTTLSSYTYSLSVIVPYFRERKITLAELRAKDIEAFYNSQLDRVKGKTVVKYHANIHSALKYAVRMELIPANPADVASRPKMEQFTASFYDAGEMDDLLSAVKDSKLELAVMLGFYGLRRSEIVGLKWGAVDFKQNTITIRYTVTSCNLDGKREIVEKERTKNKSSRRTLPMIPALSEKLLRMREEQTEYRRLCGRSYNKAYLDFVYVDEMGDRVKPDYISSAFQNVLKKHCLKRVRFHDLRHSCASLLLANGVSMKQIQEWLGHSDFGTTANIYAHLAFDSKLASADALNVGTAFGRLTQGAAEDVADICDTSGGDEAGPDFCRSSKPTTAMSPKF
jgi:integrase